MNCGVLQLHVDTLLLMDLDNFSYLIISNTNGIFFELIHVLNHFLSFFFS